jgi:hypothetical protein
LRYWGNVKRKRILSLGFTISEKKANLVRPKKIKPCPNEPEN